MKQVKRLLAAILIGMFSIAVHAGAMSDYMENKGIDWLLRAQTFTPPATQYWALFTTTCTDAGPGTEVSGGSYARAAVTASLANWSGTQGTGTTVASSGTSGTSYNNNAVAYAQSSAAWGVLTSTGLMDASTAGNRLICIDLTSTLNVSGSGFTVQFPANSLNFQMDN